MSDTSLFESLFTEELYVIPPVVCVVLEKAWDSMTEEERNLLQKILGSVKLSTAAVRIITAARIEPGMIENFNAEKVLAFGAALPCSIPLYEATRIDGIDIIATHPISQLDDARKKSLWVALKKAFNV